MSATFCILPWIHMDITPEGTVKACCRARAPVSDEHGNAMTVYHHTLEEIWNSSYYRSIRAGMLQGEKISECQKCYLEEDKFGTSYRTRANTKWKKQVGTLLHSDPAKRSRVQEYRVENAPIYFQLNIGNLCNLKCRMCSSTYSSRIETDPVHSQWAPYWEHHSEGVAYWDAHQVHLGPSPVAGVATLGFHEYIPDLKAFRRTSGNATIEFSLPQEVLVDRLSVRLLATLPEHQYLTLLLNHHVLFDGKIPLGSWNKEFDLSGMEHDGQIKIRILSGAGTGQESRPEGIAFEELILYAPPSLRMADSRVGSGASLGFRFPTQKPWFVQDQFLIDEMLRESHNIRELYFTGGEPFITPKVHQILDELIARDSTRNVMLKFNTNCTRVPDSLLKKLAQFRRVELMLSLDGFGKYYEYMRYPAKWDIVVKNVEKLRTLPNVTLCAVPIVQIYNALNIVELCTFCDSIGVDFRMGFLQTPSQLAVSVLPGPARSEAARRLREYAADGCQPKNRKHVLDMANYIEHIKDRCRPKMLRTFMEFTNDMDVTRQQQFSEVHPELLAMIKETGFQWSSKTRYATRAGHI